MLIVEVVGFFEAAVHYYNMSNIEYPKKPDVDESLFPHVDVFVATYDEPVELLYKTINACVNMDYPDKSKVHIYICDDSARPKMRILAEKMKVNYLCRENGKDAKAGNLNNALKNTSSPLIVTFDADMIPMNDFLTTCVPYFCTGEKVGFVQTPQSFYNPDLFQYNLFSEGRIPNEQDYFYRDVQVARNKSNSVIYGGSNTMISREALAKIGGFYTKVITEDFATGMKIQSEGYKCYAIDEIHASGLSPSDLRSLINQRKRWARGCIQTGKKMNLFFNKGLSIEQKLSYISAISYWYGGLKRLAYIMAPIMFSVFGVVVLKCNLIQVLIFWLPMYLFSDASLKKLSNNIRTTKWTNIYETILFPSLLPAIILETFGISQKKFQVTRKDRKGEDKYYQIKQSIPHIIFAVLSLIGIINCIRLTFISGSPAYTVLLFWLIINLYNITMALFFMFGRKLYRNTERFKVEVQCEIVFGNEKITCATSDVSEGGAAIMLDTPKFIPYDENIMVTLSNKRYSSIFEAKVVHVVQINKRWKYALEVKAIDDYNLRQLLGITYDREPTLPKNLDRYSSIFDDIRLNILKRGKKSILLNRKLPRIELEKELKSIECDMITVLNFNYEFIVIKTDIFTNLSQYITIPILKELPLKCVMVKKLNDKAENKGYKKIYLKNNDCKVKNSGKHSKGIGKVAQVEALYKIENYKEIVQDTRFNEVLLQWMDEYKDKELIKKQTKLEIKRLEEASEFNELKYL